MKKKPVSRNDAVVPPARSKISRSSGSGSAARRTRAEDISRDIEERFRSLFSRSPLGIALADGQRRCIAVNEAFCSMLGYTKEELLGASVLDITHPDDKPASEIRFEGLISGTSQGYNIEKRCIRKDGGVLWANVTTVPITFSDGNFAYGIGIFEDITERKRSEEALQDSEEKYRTLVENATEGILIIQNGMMKFCNRRASEITGYSKQELLSKPFFEFIHPDDRAKIGEYYRRRLQGDLSIPKYAFRSIRKDGSSMWLEISAVLVTWEGNPVTLNFLRDVTERKQAEEALAAERGLLRTLIDYLPDNIFIKDTRGGIILDNVAHRRLLGRQELGDVAGKSDRDFFEPALADRYMEDERRIVESGRPLINYEEPTVDREGRRHWYLTTKVPVRDSHGNITALVGINHDITERKKAEDILRANKIQLALIHDNVYDIIFTIKVEPDDHFRFGSVNRRFLEVTGLPEDQVVGKPVQEVIPEPAQALVFRKYRDAIQNRQPVHWEEISVYPAGTKVGEVTIAPIFDAAGNCTQLIGTIHDITERKQAEHALKENEERLRDITFSSADWVWEVDENGVYTYSSQKGLDLLGLSLENVIGKTPFDFMPADEAKRVAAIFAEIAAAKAPIKDLENWNITKSGERVCFLTNGVPILDSAGNLKGYRGVDKDITERKQAEDRIQQSLREKETLLREVYHRTKNNMNVISAMLSLRSESCGDEATARTLRDIEDRIKAMALVHQKLYESPDLSRIDMRDYLIDLTSLLMKTSRPPDGLFRLECEAEPLRVPVDMAIPLGMIVTELFSNVFKHALPENGEVGVRLHLAQSGSGEIELTFSDEGIGVPPGFDFRGSQTLGLQTIFMLVEHQLQGRVDFQSGRGVTCRIRIPAPDLSVEART